MGNNFENDCIRPEYMRQFQCDSQACGCRCCKEWVIAIDRSTYHRYCLLDPGPEREELLSHLVYDKERHLYTVVLSEDGTCPFRGEDLLCSIQKRHGESFLSELCHMYPRVTYRLPGLYEQSLTVTCPVAARLVLLPERPMQFEHVALEPSRQKQLFDWTGRKLRFQAHFLELQQAGIWILQDRRFPLERRLLHLLVFFAQADRLPEDADIGEALPAMLEALPEEAPRHARPFRPELHAERLVDAFARLYGMELEEWKRAGLVRAYLSNRPELLPGLRASYGHMMENYLVNEFFLHVYPYALRPTFLYSSAVLVAVGKAVEFSLLMAAISKQGKVGTEDVLLMYDRMAERLDHHKDGLPLLREGIDTGISLEDIPAFAESMIDSEAFADG